jgi:hypothetical protein
VLVDNGEQGKDDMTATTFKLSTLGLDHRDDMIVRLMLSVVDGKTSATWRRVDSFDADLLFCSPSSALAAAAVRRAADTGRPICVSLLAAGQSALPGTRGVSTRLRVDSFIALLDEMSDTLLAAAAGSTLAAPKPRMAAAPRASTLAPVPSPAVVLAPPAPTRVPVAAVASSREIAGLACALHEVMADRVGSAWRIDIGDTSLVVLTGEKLYQSREPLTPATLAMLSRMELDLRLERLASDDPLLDRVRADGQPLHELLWGCGLGSPNDRLLPWLPEDAPVRLRDWPAFRRDDCVPAHTGFAALLTWSAHTIESIVELTGRSAGEVRAFINACALCGLVVQATQPELAVRQGATPRPRRTTAHGLSLAVSPRTATLLPLVAATALRA